MTMNAWARWSEDNAAIARPFERRWWATHGPDLAEDMSGCSYDQEVRQVWRTWRDRFLAAAEQLIREKAAAA